MVTRSPHHTRHAPRRSAVHRRSKCRAEWFWYRGLALSSLARTIPIRANNGDRHRDDDYMDLGDDRVRDKMENGRDDHNVRDHYDDRYDRNDHDYDREDAHRVGVYSVSLGDGSVRY